MKNQSEDVLLDEKNRVIRVQQFGMFSLRRPAQ